ncbi:MULTISPECIES: mechanosensitive ion channel domain-containing protein [unclassified Isoptericola]|uniref:mechanosensitive ion channel domain-containing protein n=1 Tax=unclassified Isoptericola TaxID=2623355 RepID=UPI003655A3C1
MSSWFENLFAGMDLSGWHVVLALLSVVLGWLLGRFSARGVFALVGRVQGLAPELPPIAARAVRYFFVLLGVGVALAFLGANLQPLLAGVLIVGVVGVLALRGVADNFGASVVLQTRMPIRLGDEVETQDWHGIVTEMNGRSVVLRTSTAAPCTCRTPASWRPPDQSQRARRTSRRGRGTHRRAGA